MNQIKIGKFIAECRKKNNLTQMQLAEKFNKFSYKYYIILDYKSII